MKVSHIYSNHNHVIRDGVASVVPALMEVGSSTSSGLFTDEEVDLILYKLHQLLMEKQKQTSQIMRMLNNYSVLTNIN